MTTFFRHKILTVLALAGFLVPFKSHAAPPKAARFSSALNWVTKSREYKAVCLQTYANAWEKVAAAAKKQKGPWAIVMDVDETVLNNMQYQVELNAKGESHSQEAWEKWVKRKESPPVPGVKAFIRKLRKVPGGRIIFLSNRYAHNTELTRQNLGAHGMVEKVDVFLFRKVRADKKSIRRQEVFDGSGRMGVYGKLKVLAWFGDSAHDFPEGDGLKWGREKFMLPNPVYGTW